MFLGFWFGGKRNEREETELSIVVGFGFPVFLRR